MPNPSEHAVAASAKALVLAYLQRTEPVHPRLALLIGELARECYYIERGAYPPDHQPLDEGFRILRQALPARGPHA